MFFPIRLSGADHPDHIVTFSERYHEEPISLRMTDDDLSVLLDGVLFIVKDESQRVLEHG
jgi:hypothetical protein